MEVRICSIGCTHTFHDKIKIPECDILIHTGDYTKRGSNEDVSRFLEWFSKQPGKKVFINGNHDLNGDPKHDSETVADKWWPILLDHYTKDGSIHYLENSSIELFGLNIWGSPITPDFYPEYWAFNKPRGKEIDEVWKTIPINTDIVITHGPPAMIGDYILSQQRYVGCEDLRFRLEEIKPQLHICSHIHEGYGIVEKPDTTYINASVCNASYNPINKPILITLEI